MRTVSRFFRGLRLRRKSLPQQSIARSAVVGGIGPKGQIFDLNSFSWPAGCVLARIQPRIRSFAASCSAGMHSYGAFPGARRSAFAVSEAAINSFVRNQLNNPLHPHLAQQLDIALWNCIDIRVSFDCPSDTRFSNYMEHWIG